MPALAIAAAAVLVGAGARAANVGQASNRLPVGSAAAFVDSIGIQVHLHNTGTAYANERYPIVRDRLLALGLRHVRDGLIDTTWKPYYAHIEELAERGMRFDLVTAVDASQDLIQTYPTRVPGAIESYEGPNEADQNAAASWPAAVVAFQRRLYASVHADPALRGIRVIAPSFTSEAAALTIGDLSAMVDCGNAHIYFAGRNPGTAGWGDSGRFGTYGSLGYNVALARVVASQKPLIVTESGYATAVRTTDAVSPVIAARYLPRVLLENWNAGIARTYLYELVDAGTKDDGGFGLLDETGEPKPAYHAIKNFVAALDAIGSSTRPADLRCALHGSPDVHATLLAGSRGRFVLAVWREVPGSSPATRIPLAIATQPATLTCDRVLADGSMQTFADDGEFVPSRPLAAANSLGLTVSDRVTLVSFRATSSEADCRC